MDCCVLSDSEVGRLRNYNLALNHADHVHIDAKLAIKGVLDSTYDLIEHNGRTYVTPCKLYFLQRTRSGFIDTIQRVKSNSLLELMPIR